MSWIYLNVGLNNNKFYSIEFYNANKEKFSAESNYNNILSALKSKYKMVEMEPKDNLTYKVQKGEDNKGHIVVVWFCKGESIGHEIWYYSYLQYGDINIEEESINEL